MRYKRPRNKIMYLGDNSKYIKPRLKVQDLPGEEWRVIPGLNGRNFLSNFARFKILELTGDEKIKKMKPAVSNTNKKYERIHLAGINKICFLSRAMAKTFIDSNFPLWKVSDEVVDHIDNDESNNMVENLRICTQSDNIKYAHKEQKIEFGKKMSELGKNLGYSRRGTIRDDLRKKILCVETGQQFDTRTHAASYIKESQNLESKVESIVKDIYRSTKKKNSKAYGYTWKYLYKENGGK